MHDVMTLHELILPRVIKGLVAMRVCCLKEKTLQSYYIILDTSVRKPEGITFAHLI